MRNLTSAYQFHEEVLRLWTALSNHLGYYGQGEAHSSEHRRQLKRRNGTRDAITAKKPHYFSNLSRTWVEGTRTRAGPDYDENFAGEDRVLRQAMEEAKAHGGRDGNLPRVEDYLRTAYPTKASPVGPAMEAIGMMGTEHFQGALGELY